MKKIILLLIAAPSMLFASVGVGLSIHQVDNVDTGYGDVGFDLNTINLAWENRFEDNLAVQVKFGFGTGDDSDKDEAVFSTYNVKQFPTLILKKTDSLQLKLKYLKVLKVENNLD